MSNGLGPRLAALVRIGLRTHTRARQDLRDHHTSAGPGTEVSTTSVPEDPNPRIKGTNLQCGYSISTQPELPLYQISIVF